MNSFAERLKIALEKRNLSQAEAARKCGLSQQSINYIIKNNLKTSKLGTEIATALNINPEWLIYGRGKFEESKIYELPIMHSYTLLKKFINNELKLDKVDYIVTEFFLGYTAFAYLLEPRKLIICGDESFISTSGQYLTFDGSSSFITDLKGQISFPVFEWRIRYEDF